MHRALGGDMLDELSAPDGGSGGMRDLTRSEQFLLGWLSASDSSAYGECHGGTLDALAALGLVEIGPTPDGKDQFYRRVWLTSTGWEVLAWHSSSSS